MKKMLGKDFEKLKKKNVMIVGVGGIGCTAANLLARMQIRLTIIDSDIVNYNNLERQILFDKNDLFKKKVIVAKEKLKLFTDIKTADKRLTKENIGRIINKKTDLIIDCTDNAETRLLINDYCKKNKISWVYTGAVANIGTVYFNATNPDRACFQCFNQEKQGETSCDIGVSNSIVNMTASLAVSIAVEYLISGNIEKELIRINLKNNTMTKLSVKKNPECMACRGKYAYL